MCYTALIYKTDKAAAQKAQRQAIINAILAQTYSNNNGFALLSETGQPLRTMEKAIFNKKFISEFNNPDQKWHLVHFRLATAGQKTLDNIHLWERNGHFFAHNGVINSLSYDKVKSDSLLFFENLINDAPKQGINYDNIKDLLDKHPQMADFYGRGFIVNPDNDVFMFGDFIAYYIDGYVIISSAPLFFGNSLEFGDLEFSIEPATPPLTAKLDGICGFDGHDFDFLGDIEAEHLPTYSWQKNNDWQDDVRYYNRNPKQIGFSY